MKFVTRLSHLLIVASALLLALTVLAGLVPWKLVAAESEDGVGQSAERVATIKISEGEKGKPATVLCAPRIVFLPGNDAGMSVGDSRRRLELTVRSSTGKTPIEHAVEIRLIGDPDGENPVVLSAPKITLADGRTGTVLTAHPDGSWFEVEATVEPVDATSP